MCSCPSPLPHTPMQTDTHAPRDDSGLDDEIIDLKSSMILLLFVVGLWVFGTVAFLLSHV
jgi:hypothetical protein